MSSLVYTDTSFTSSAVEDAMLLRGGLAKDHSVAGLAYSLMPASDHVSVQPRKSARLQSATPKANSVLTLTTLKSLKEVASPKTSALVPHSELTAAKQPSRAFRLSLLKSRPLPHRWRHKYMDDTCISAMTLAIHMHPTTTTLDGTI